MSAKQAVEIPISPKDQTQLLKDSMVTGENVLSDGNDDLFHKKFKHLSLENSWPLIHHTDVLSYQ